MMSAEKKMTAQQIEKTKTDKIMNIVAERASFYRANPQRFVKDFLDIDLRLFQKILIYAMMVYDCFFFVAARGLGKTYLVALFAVVRSILYPGSKILVFSATFKQGKEVILKITDDFMHKSPLLCNEILKYSTGQNDAGVWFKNGSWIQVRVASENSRGARANIVIIDECRMVTEKIIQTVIVPMNASPREPGYLKNPEYMHLQEENKQMFLSSAWYKQSEMYERVKSYFANNLDSDRKYFLCDLPYQLSIKEGLLMRSSIENEMSEATFSDVSFMMEREGRFYGSSENALFNLNTLNNRRNIRDSFFDLEFYRETGTKIPQKQLGEKRILSLDVALLASKKHDNDASCFILNQLQTKDANLSNIVYVDTKEGLVTEELGLCAMRYFYQYDCDFFALDSSGVGQPLLDYVMQDRYDPVYGVWYKAMTCVNNDDLASRCKVRDANKVVYAIKANAKSNNDMCLALRTGFQNGYINLLVDEMQFEMNASKIYRGYNKLTENQKERLRLPYYQTSFLINELINLDHDVSNGLIRVKEKSGMRKDRYSSLEYNYYVVNEISRKKRRDAQINNLADLLPIRRGRIK